jgi:HlyD family secretion protein
MKIMNRSTVVKWSIVAAALAALAGGGWWWAAHRADGDLTYRTAKIERGSLQAAVSASGTVTPVTQVQISSQVSGQIKELFVDFNSPVTQNQLIARLDPETFEYRVRQATADVEASRASVLTAQANVLQALAQVSRAQVELGEAQRELDRNQSLVAQNFISPAQLDTSRAKVATLAESAKAARAQVQVAQAQGQNAQAIVRQREAQLQQARVDLERTQIRSPVDGIVIKRSVEVGQTVAASLQAPELFVIARNLNDMQVEAAIDEADISRVRLAQPASFTIDAFPGRNFEGAVKQVRKAAVSAQNVVTYTVVVGFANPGTSVLPGMTANVRIVTEMRENVLKVPNAALRVRIAGVEPEGGANAAQRVGWSLVPSAMAQEVPVPQRGASRPGGGEGRGGGQFGAMRDRLASELQLTPQQLEKVDAIFAAQRSRMAELRNLPEEERGKARERMTAEMRAQIAEQLTPEQKAKYQQLAVEMASRQVTRGRIYLLADNGKPKAYNVRLGVSDGVMTELVAPTPPEVKEGATVITAAIGADRPQAPGTQRGGLRAPF